MNGRLNDIVAWGKICRVAFTPHKSQLKLDIRTQAHVHTEDEVEMQGVTCDNNMTCKRHVEHRARKAT